MPLLVEGQQQLLIVAAARGSSRVCVTSVRLCACLEVWCGLMLVLQALALALMLPVMHRQVGLTLRAGGAR